MLAFVGNAVRMGQTVFKVPSMDAGGEQYAEAGPQPESAEETITGEKTIPCLPQQDTAGAEAAVDAGEPAGGCSEAQAEQEEQAAKESSQTAIATSAADSEPPTSGLLQRGPCARSDSDASETSGAAD